MFMAERFYYDSAMDAVYMCTKHGLRLRVQLKMIVSVFPYVKGAKQLEYEEHYEPPVREDKIYADPSCHKIFLPHENDVGLDVNGDMVTFRPGLGWVTMNGTFIKAQNTVVIIRRRDHLFINPQREL